jgi:hypothetical protein
MRTRDISRGWCVRLTLPPSSAVCIEIWDPQLPETINGQSTSVKGLLQLLPAESVRITRYVVSVFTDASIIIVWRTAGHEFIKPEIFPTIIVKNIQALYDVTPYRLVYNIGVSKV